MLKDKCDPKGCSLSALCATYENVFLGNCDGCAAQYVIFASGDAQLCVYYDRNTDRIPACLRGIPEEGILFVLHCPHCAERKQVQSQAR